MYSFIRKLLMLKKVINDQITKKQYHVNVYNTMETLNYIKQNHCSISRYGDSEFNIIRGEMPVYQDFDEVLVSRLKRILSDANNREINHVVGIPYTMYKKENEYTIKSQMFWMKYCALYRKEIYQFLNSKQSYFDSQITRVYINRKFKQNAKSYFDLWRNIWDRKQILIIEGALNHFGIGNDLFDNTKSVKRILCPPTNAFKYYDKILKTTLENLENVDLVLIVLGPTATVLARDLAEKGLWAIDIGNMDMEYEWSLKRVKVPIKIAGKYSIEVKDGENVEDLEDVVYRNQIIAKIGC